MLNLDDAAVSLKTPSKRMEQQELEAWLRLGVELLNENDREVIVLRQWEDLPFEEIGKRLEITANAARMRNERAVGRLAKLLGRLRRGNLADILQDHLE